MSAVLPRIEHTALGPETTPSTVETVLDEAATLGLRACVPPWYLAEAAASAPAVDLVTVVGFPHGQDATEAKRAAARIAVADGADEVDVVANRGFLLAGEVDRYREDVAAVVDAVDVPVKVIVEAPALDRDRLRTACELLARTDAAYLKTATGFGDGGATVPDVELLAEYLPVKASGGVDSWERARDLLAAGAERIGASRGAAIAREYLAATAGDDAPSAGSGPDDGGDR